MGYHQQCHLGPLQVALKPLDYFNVEMVGRFVQDKELRILQYNTCQGNPLPLPTGQR